MPGRIITLVPDLLLEVRIDEAARRIDAELDALSSAAYLDTALSKPTDVLIVDLGVDGLDLEAIVSAAEAHNVPIVAFGPHVDVERLKAAKDAGMGSVLPRSAFLKGIRRILSELIATDQS
ncbi:MAG: hypothetical protein IH957_08520 [Chloroflexi bacterium]|nr:hypothetical protein [Chloroflexota bacterium]